MKEGPGIQERRGVSTMPSYRELELLFSVVMDLNNPSKPFHPVPFLSIVSIWEMGQYGQDEQDKWFLGGFDDLYY